MNAKGLNPGKRITLAVALVACSVAVYCFARFASYSGPDLAPPDFFYASLAAFVALVGALVLALMRVSRGARDRLTTASLAACVLILPAGVVITALVESVLNAAGIYW